MLLTEVRRFHLGHDDGRNPASLNKFKNLLKRTKIGETCPNFRACEELVNHVYDGHVLALCMNVLQVETIDQLNEKLSQCDVTVLVDKVFARGFDIGLVHKMRTESGYYEVHKTKDPTPEALQQCDEASDVVLENAILFLQVVTVYREMSNGIQ